MGPGLSMGANNLNDSSHQDAGGPGHGLGISDLPDFLDPSITINHSLNPTPVQSQTIFNQRETHMKTADSDIMSPGPLKMPATLATCTSFLQQLSPNSLLQVPKMHDFHSTPPSPSAKTSPNVEHSDGSSMLRRNTKSKPMASAKKAEEVSEELATKITKFIDLYRGPSTDMRASIKNQLLLTFNPELSRKRCAQMASLKDGPDTSKKRLIACDQCPTTTARQCDMKYVHHWAESSRAMSQADRDACTGNTRSGTRGPMAVPSPAARRSLAVRTIGNDMRIRSIIKSKRGDVMNAPRRTRWVNVPESSIAESSSKVTFERNTGLKKTKTFGIDADAIASDATGKRHSGVASASGLSS